MRAFLLALAICLVVAGCSGGDRAGDPADDPAVDRSATASPRPSESSAPESPESPTSATPSPPVARGPAVRIPDFTAVEFRNARQWLTDDGFVVRSDVLADCRLLKGVVVAQQPSAGTRVRSGDTVTLTFGRTPAAATCAARPAPALTRAFLAWATGRAGPPDFAPSVRLLQGHRQVATLTADRATDRTAWQLPAGYAERGATNLLDWMDDQVLLQPSRGLTAYCLVHAAPLAPDLVDRLRWSSALHTASADACLQVGAVQVWVDDDERIAAVNFLTGAP